MKKNFLFSVIIPVYNVEAYLEETINSVLAQDIGFEAHIQIILVNDGSPDNSEAICLRYQDAYPENITYIKQENAGVSAARNAGIPYIKGKYVNFLDSDDKWAPDVFRLVNDFYEQHGDKIDVVSCRIQFFEAKTGYHALDYKFIETKLDRVIDITYAYNELQLHASSSFFRTESIGDTRFDSKIRFGEDALFTNQIILKKLKYGALGSADYFYRSRMSQNSAIQSQQKRPEWFFDSPKYFLEGLAKYCIQTQGTLLLYVQSVIFYDMGYRLTKSIPDFFSQEDHDRYLESLRYLLRNYVSDRVILTQKRWKRDVQMTALKLKYGEQFKHQFSFGYNTLCFGAFPLNKKFSANKTLLRILYMDIQDKTLYLEGAIVNWSMCPLGDLGDSIELYFYSAGQKRQAVTWLPEDRYTPSDYRKTINGMVAKRNLFRVAIPLKKGVTTITPKIHIQGYYTCRLPFSFGKFAPLSHKLEHSYCFLGRYLLQLNAPHQLKISKPKYKTKALLTQEFALERELRALGKGHLNHLRRKALWLIRRNKKKIWLVSDRPDVAGDNGESFFKYLVKHCPPDVDPYFVIRQDVPDYQRMKQYGKVIATGSQKHLIYTLASDCYIDSSGIERIMPPYRADALYFADLNQTKYVFLQHGIIKDDLSLWLQKPNKNIRMFVTSASPEYHSILESPYGYTEREIALTGLARYDTLLERAAFTEKKRQLLIMPTWRKSATRLPAADPEAAAAPTNTSVYRLGFQDTPFFQFYQPLIQHPRLLAAMERYNYTGLFCLHPNQMAQHVDFTENDRIKLHHGFLNYSEAFASSSILLTDYSSTPFDFAYLQRPVVYTQFDRKEFFSSHTYQEGYFDYERDGFGPVCYDLESTVDTLIHLMEQDAALDPKYQERIQHFFAYTDNKNCERTLNAILALD